MMTPNEGLPVNEVDVEDAQPKESAKTASNHKKKIAAVALLAHKKKIAAVALLACVGALVGLLVAKPWQSDEATATATAAADEVVLAASWPHDNSDIQPDPRVKYGELENGLRYMVMENAEPPNQLMLRMHFNVGSYHEEEDQLGLAHFLEHMVS